jgi:hypothetical protein
VTDNISKIVKKNLKGVEGVNLNQFETAFAEFMNDKFFHNQGMPQTYIPTLPSVSSFGHIPVQQFSETSEI